MARQMRLDALLNAAEARQIAVKPEVVIDSRSAQPLVLARLKGRPAGAPRPVPGSDGTLALHDGLPPAVRRAEELDLALSGLELTQNALLDALERAMEDRLEQLARVPAELGLSTAATGGIGGPFVELRGVDAPLQPRDPFQASQEMLHEVDELQQVVAALPIRSPLDADLRVSSNYGPRQDPFLGRTAMHTGMDFAAPRGTPVKAAASGTVRFAGWNGGYGRMIEIDHGNGHRTRYGHLSKISVAKGEIVSARQTIGAVGSSGRSTGPHLHYELARDGRRRDPAPYLDAGDSLGEAI